MELKTRLPIKFPKIDSSAEGHPEVSDHTEGRPKENLLPAEPVGGRYTVTATLPTIEDIIDQQEGRKQFQYGYYRFIDNPLLCEIQEGLKAYYQLRHCLVYSSFKTAALELLNYLLLLKPQMTLKVITDFEDDSPFSLNQSFSALQTTIVSTSLDKPTTLEPFSKAKDELFVLHLKDSLSFIESQLEFLNKIKSQRVPIIVITDQYPIEPWPNKLINYWVLPLNKTQQAITGGTILSNMDRQMAELFELRKQIGPILSSRDAAYFLGKENAPNHSSQEQVIKFFCSLEQAQHGFVFPSGMKAITTLLSLLRQPNKAQVIVVGHLYTDTYTHLTYAKQRLGYVENIFLGVNELDQLSEVINDQTAVIITETITNPLNDVPDLELIAQVAKKHQIPVIVDNTFATPLGCNPLELGLDFVIHSTTKYFNGENDHGGGVILLNDEAIASKIHEYQKQWNCVLSPLESSILWERLQSFEKRMEQFQINALKMASFLKNHPAIDRIFFHRLPTHRCYEVSQRILKGPGSVMSFTLKRPGLEGLRQFYDSPLTRILKAPSLGSNQTILCPYTLLAHYHESDEILKELGLSRFLVRISVGCEDDLQPVIESLEEALQ